MSEQTYDASAAELDEKTRKLLATQGAANFYFFTRVILQYNDLTEAFHLPVCEFLQQTTKPDTTSRRLVLMPRSTFKSTLCTIAYVMWRLVNNPNLQVLIISDTEKNASRFMREIQMHFERNEIFRATYPEMIPPSFTQAIWNATEMMVENRTSFSRDPSVDAIGVGGGAESRHYDLIVGDDLITEKAIHSDLEMERAIEWTAGLESLLVKPADEILFVGSRKKRADLYDSLMDKFGGASSEEVPVGPHTSRKGGLLIYSRAAIEDGAAVFPERIGLDFLKRLSETDPERYNSQYANNPIASGKNFFRPKDINFFEWSDDGRLITHPDANGKPIALSPFTMERMCLYDPSKAERMGSSKNAQLIIAKGEGPIRYIIDGRVAHYPPDEAVDQMFEWQKRWRPSTYLIEHRGYQGSIKYWLQERTDRDGLPPLDILEWPFPGSEKAIWSKIERIKGLIPLFRAGYVWLAPHLRNSELHDELLYYPNVRWDDGIDCMAMSLDVWEWFDDPGANAENYHRENELLGFVYGDDRTQGKTEREPFNEEEFLKGIDFTGYGFRMPG